MKRAPQPRLALEVLLLRVIHLEPVMPLADWLARLDTLEKRLEAGPGVASESAAPGSASRVRGGRLPGSARRLRLPGSRPPRRPPAARRSGGRRPH